jgi:hypothetical protein
MYYFVASSFALLFRTTSSSSSSSSIWRSLIFSNAIIIIIILIIGCCCCYDDRGGVVNATTPLMLPLPSQILRARIPSSSEEEQQQQQQQLWLYEGALYDPLDGRQVAKVQGIELIRPIMNTTNLAIDSILRHPNATYDDAQTLWSQKVFCYTKTKSKRNNNNNENENGETIPIDDILRSVRIRPQSPRKDVPLDQAVAVYETATTFISRRRRRKQQQQHQKDNDDDDDADLLIHSEFPNGQTMWGNTQELRCQQNTNNNNPSSTTTSSSSSSLPKTKTKSGSGNIDFTIFAKIRSKRSPLFAPDLTDSDEDNDNNSNAGRRRKKGNNSNDDDIIVSPKRSALIQFGSSNDNMESKHKFGARETYSYRNIPLSTTATATESPRPLWKRITKLTLLRNNKNRDDTPITSSSSSIYYTRYGEGPPFYAPGRMCMLEMQGRPIYDLKEASPILQRLLQKNDDDEDGGSGSGGPVVGFHYKNNQNNEDHNNNNDDATSMTWSSKITAPPSIQTAWNLNKRKRNNNDKRRIGASTARRIPSSSATNSQQLLRLKVQDPADGSVHGSNDIRTWTKRAEKQVVAIWDRIRASTTLESGN